jgi:thiamine-monophosphate kinase
MKSEFDFISNLRRENAVKNLQFSGVKVGIGDDCAVVKHNSKTDLVITTDLLIEEIDFRLEWTKPEFAGHKALAVSLSDVAAMGAKPIWALVSIGIPEKIWKTDFVEKFYAGWFRLAKKFNVELIGGDVSRTPDKIVIDSIVAGEVKKNRSVLRSGACAGDLIFVTGELGGAAAGLELLRNDLRYDEANSFSLNKLLLRQLQPFPRCEIGEKIGEKKLATAMIDLSDGLSSDLAHLCAESRVGAKIELDKIPNNRRLKNYRKHLESKEFDLDVLSLALNGGEDFELLFTARPKNKNKLKELFGKNVTCIGRTTSDAGKIELVGESKTTQLEAKGFRHF